MKLKQFSHSMKNEKQNVDLTNAVRKKTKSRKHELSNKDDIPLVEQTNTQPGGK